MRSKGIAVLFVPLILVGCASVTSTIETQTGYSIYDVKPAEGVTASKIGDAIKVALQKNMNRVQLTNMIPPATFPEKPGRFQVSNPLKGTAFGALAAQSGQSLEIPSCEGSLLTATAQNTSMSRYGEGNVFFLCLLPYQGGYHIDIYTQFKKRSGGISPQALGATLARSVVGDSSQLVPRTINAVVESVEAAGGKTKLIEQYP
jgi:hypothetical protein